MRQVEVRIEKDKDDMKELRCPKCGNVFQVDEADYASIVSQVRNVEFQQEIDRRLAELREQQESERKAIQAESEKTFQEKLFKKEQSLGEKDNEIMRLKGLLEAAEEKKKLELDAALASKDKEIASLQNTINLNEGTLKMAVLQEQQKSQAALQAKDLVISGLKAQSELDLKEAELREKSLMEQHKKELEAKDEQVAFYKDFKARKSTKGIGESLEQYCYKVYNQSLRAVMPNATFEKDNDATEGSKGDFIFRDSEDGTEYISIMFEMKNENDTTATKHRNADFFEKLDKDRTTKKCEFAVLVTMLELDNDMYNEGIVVAPGYEKMYVVRPENFIPLITLLVQTSRKSLEYKKELAVARSQSVDVTKFEENLEEFRTKFGQHASYARERFDDAIKDIDATIKKLQAVRDNLVKSDNYVRLASGDVEGLTIRKLTYGNRTMKAQFDAARAARAAEKNPDEQ